MVGATRTTLEPSAALLLHPQQPESPCTGGHLTDPNEQKTQQSPRFGRSSTRQFVHS